MTDFKLTGSEVYAWDKFFHAAFIRLARERGKSPSREEDQWEFIIELASEMADQMIIARRQRLPHD